MSDRTVSMDALLERIDRLGRELEQLKRDVLHSTSGGEGSPTGPKSLFGSVPSDDISEEMITAATRRLFRPSDDI